MKWEEQQIDESKIKNTIDTYLASIIDLKDPYSENIVSGEKIRQLVNDYITGSNSKLTGKHIDFLEEAGIERNIIQLIRRLKQEKSSDILEATDSTRFSECKNLDELYVDLNRAPLMIPENNTYRPYTQNDFNIGLQNTRTSNYADLRSFPEDGGLRSLMGKLLISEVSTFKELQNLLFQIPELKSSGEMKSGVDWITTINDCLQGKKVLNRITDNFKLRTKVHELLGELSNQEATRFQVSRTLDDISKNLQQAYLIVTRGDQKLVYTAEQYANDVNLAIDSEFSNIPVPTEAGLKDQTLKAIIPWAKTVDGLKRILAGVSEVGGVSRDALLATVDRVNVAEENFNTVPEDFGLQVKLRDLLNAIHHRRNPL